MKYTYGIFMFRFIWLHHESPVDSYDLFAHIRLGCVTGT